MDPQDDELMTLQLDGLTLCRDRYVPLWKLRQLAEAVARNDREREAVKPLLEAMVTRDAAYCLATLREIQEAFGYQRGAGRWFPRLNSLLWDVEYLIRTLEADLASVRTADDCEARDG